MEGFISFLENFNFKLQNCLYCNPYSGGEASQEKSYDSSCLSVSAWSRALSTVYLLDSMTVATFYVWYI